MSASNKPDAEELIVKACFFAPMEVEEDNLRKFQRELIRTLQQEGYRQSDTDPIPWGSTQRTMDFHLYDGVPIEEENSISERVKDFFGFGRNADQRKISKEEFLKGLAKVRDDLPYRFIFHFKTYQDEEIEGYDIEVESIPALLQKYRQLSIGEDYEYNISNVVNENKRELKRIMGKFGLEPLRGPASEANMENENQNMSSDPANLFNQYSVTAQLQAIVEPDEQIHQDYQKAVREFNHGEYEDAIRDVGRAGETLIELLCSDLYEERDVPGNANGRLNKLDNTEDGIPSYIGKTISPLWWLRNKVNHPTEYEITKDDAHYALICFQIAVEKYVEEYSDVDVVY
jgi:hypothetical protein